MISSDELSPKVSTVKLVGQVDRPSARFMRRVYGIDFDHRSDLRFDHRSETDAAAAACSGEATMNDTTQHETHDLVVSRDIPAPIEAAWKSWTEPDRVLRWSGPNGFTGRSPSSTCASPARTSGDERPTGGSGAVQHLGVHARRRTEPPRVHPQHRRRARRHDRSCDHRGRGHPARDAARHHVRVDRRRRDSPTRHRTRLHRPRAARALEEGLEESLDKLVAIYVPAQPPWTSLYPRGRAHRAASLLDLHLCPSYG